MPWLNFDDQYPEHPKIDRLSDGAFRLHTAGIFYCGRLMTDGYIPADRVGRLVRQFRRRDLAELTAGPDPLWVAVDGQYQIHDYLEWNKSRSAIEEERKKRKQAGEEGARKRWHSR